MPSLPKLDPIIVDAFIDMLISEQEMFRPPEKAAAMLALICELHLQEQPFPTRAEAARHINCSIPTIDAALSTRLDEGYITPDIRITEGNVQRRHSALRQRHYKPSAHLLSVYKKVKNGGWHPPTGGNKPKRRTA